MGKQLRPSTPPAIPVDATLPAKVDLEISREAKLTVSSLLTSIDRLELTNQRQCDQIAKLTEQLELLTRAVSHLTAKVDQSVGLRAVK